MISEIRRPLPSDIWIIGRPNERGITMENILCAGVRELERETKITRTKAYTWAKQLLRNGATAQNENFIEQVNLLELIFRTDILNV